MARGGMRGGGGGRSFGGGGRTGGSLGGSGRIGSVGSSNRGGRGLGGVGRAPSTPRAAAPRVTTPRAAAPRPGFGTGMAVGMGMGMMGGRRRRRGWGRRGMMMGGPMHHGGGMGRRSGCTSLIMAIILIFLVVSVIGMLGNMSIPFIGGGGLQTITVAPSTISRDPLPSGEALNIPSSMVTQNRANNWITNQNRLFSGMNDFYNRTGVRPHLYLTDNIDGNTNLPTEASFRAFAEARYHELFEDQAHVLLVFFENDRYEYAMWVTVGAQALTVMDDEAQGILMDFVMRYYYSDVDNETMFSNAFQGAGRRIMVVTRSQWIPVLIVAGILLILFLLFKWWQKKQEQKNLEAEQTERILNQELNTFSESGGAHDEASQLAQQYMNEDENNSN
ncbi:MAG: hypothetical protein FWE05_08665 [Defluviitaleaceae bacterium]|nr:hypothetical protein [Defluviitaleaceae bacterium]